LHLLRSRDLNAPLPGTYDPDVPSSGVYPLGKRGLVVLMESSGRYNQNQLIVNVNSKVNSSLSLTGSYAYGRALSDTDGLGTFPANPYSMEGEYGPAAIDMRHRVSLSGTIAVKWGIRFNPLLTANTGPPFDITAGRDVFGDTLFNDRPGIATDPTKPGVVQTRYELLEPNPAPGQPLLPRNYRPRPRSDHAEHASRQDVYLRLARRPCAGGDQSRRRVRRARRWTRRTRPRGTGKPIFIGWRQFRRRYGEPPLQPDRFDADPQPHESQQSGTDHRQHHIAALRPGQPTRRLRKLYILRERQQPAFGTANEVHLLTPPRRHRRDLGKVDDSQLLLDLARLYILHRSTITPAGSLSLVQELGERGLKFGINSIVQILRGLHRKGYTRPTKVVGRFRSSRAYQATRRGCEVAEQSRVRLRDLYDTLSQEPPPSNLLSQP